MFSRIHKPTLTWICIWSYHKDSTWGLKKRGVYFEASEEPLWYEASRSQLVQKLSRALGNLSINPSKVVPCVFIGDNITVLVYVDDCLIFLKEKDKINRLIEKLKNKGKLDPTDEGDVDKYRGVDIERNKEDKSITFKQTFLIQRAIELVGLRASNQVDIPAVNPPLSKDLEGASRTST